MIDLIPYHSISFPWQLAFGGQVRSTAHEDLHRVAGDLQWAKVGRVRQGHNMSQQKSDFW